MKKRSLTMMLCGVAMAFACIGGVATANVTANAAEHTITTETFQMKATSIRYEAPAGVRFKASISASEYEAMLEVDSELEVGTLYIPTALLVGDLEITNQTAGQFTIPSEKIKVVKNDQDVVTSYEFYSYVYDIPSNYYNEPITAVNYIECAGEYYYSTALSKSLAYTAQQAYVKEGKEEALQYIPDEQVNYTVEYYKQNLNGSYNETADETKQLSGTINTKATVSKTYDGYVAMDVEDTLIWANGSTVIKQYFAKEIGVAAYNENNKVSVEYLNNGAQAEVSLQRHDPNGGARYEHANYMYLDEEHSYESNYMRFEFKGSNPIGGVYFGVTSAFSSELKQVACFGLELNIATGGHVYKGSSDAESTREQNNFNCLNYAYFNANKDKNFVMIIGTSKQDGANNQQLNIWLYEKNGTELTLLEEVHYARGKSWNYRVGKIMVTSQFNTGADSIFKVWRPTTLANAQAALAADYTIVSAQ